MADTVDIQRIIRQQLETDRLFGLRELPIRPVAREARADSATNATPKAPASRSTHASQSSHAPHSKPAASAVGAAAPAQTSPTIVHRERASTLTREEKETHLRQLDESQVKGCRKCALCETRTKTVFGQGAADARLLFVGEAPGFEEDRQGLAFVGKAGELLTKMIAAMGLSRDEVYICNVLKCRPPGNRNPAGDEIASCSPYLHEQLTVIDPEVIVALGGPAAQTLLETKDSMGRLRGRFYDYPVGSRLDPDHMIPVMPTYHPAYLLRSPHEKGKVWDDLQKVMAKLGLSRPK